MNTDFGRTRRSLFYVVGYLIATGIALMIAPRPTLNLLFSNGNYGEVMPRVVGAFMVGLGSVVVQIVRLRLHQLYVTTMLVRLGFLVWCGYLYFISDDPLFLTMSVVISGGLLLTFLSFVSDRKAQRKLSEK